MDNNVRLELARNWYNNKATTNAEKILLKNLFSELVTSEDERVKKAITNILYENYTDAAVIEGVEIAEIVAWLEKQCEQKPADKVEPKFKVGDWIVYETEGWREVLQIDIIDEHYTFTNGSSSTFDEEQYMRLWTIEDARDGDVLVTKEDNRPFIFNGLLDSNNPNCPVAYCGIDSVNLFLISPGNHWWSDKEVCPATKEQRDLLFQKIKEAGYEWNDNEKVLVGFDNDDEQHEELEDDETDLNIKQNPSWSEEDEKRYMWIVRLIGTARFSEIESDRMPCDRNELIKWLKSLKPQPHWKPTEEQLGALLDCVNLSTKENFFELNSLYTELVKL